MLFSDLLGVRLDYFIKAYLSSDVAFFSDLLIIENHNLQATAPATTSLIPALGTGMRILAQASFATGVRGEIGRVLDGTGEKEKSLLYLTQSAISVIDFGPKSTITSMLA